MDRITSAKNPAVQRLRSLKDAKARRETGLFLVEGEVMIREALGCGLKLIELAAEEAHADFAQAVCGGARGFIVTRSLLETICDTRTPQGVCAAFELPEPVTLENLPERIVALDGVQDPGNLGTIWRTADAAGFQALLLGAGGADPLSPKVQRAAMGSGFRVPFCHAPELADALLQLRQRGYRVFASDLSGADFYAHPDAGEKFVLVIGNEARGISAAVREAADFRVKLPMRGGAESLNAAVAAGIMMYELMRGR
ncbi:MAG: RNA methyltransferase [Clostridia bacterium]|nr:RNA methyltransferase [Clostridia bacterium]